MDASHHHIPYALYLDESCSNIPVQVFMHPGEHEEPSGCCSCESIHRVCGSCDTPQLLKCVNCAHSGGALQCTECMGQVGGTLCICLASMFGQYFFANLLHHHHIYATNCIYRPKIATSVTRSHFTHTCVFSGPHKMVTLERIFTVAKVLEISFHVEQMAEYRSPHDRLLSCAEAEFVPPGRRHVPTYQCLSDST